jgi:hypothetical protein
MTLEEIKQFAHAYDPQIFHTDEDQAKAHPFSKVLPQVGGILRGNDALMDRMFSCRLRTDWFRI